MSPQVHRDKPIAVAQVRVQLPAPRQPALRDSMDEHNRTAARVARLDQMELHAAAAGDRVMLHGVAPLSIRLPGGSVAFLHGSAKRNAVLATGPAANHTSPVPVDTR